MWFSAPLKEPASSSVCNSLVQGSSAIVQNDVGLLESLELLWCALMT